MTISVVTRSPGRSVSRVCFLHCVILLMVLAPVSRAEEKSENAESMLDNLKRRSAEERWQRVKRQYPTESSATRRKSPSQLPEDHQQASPGDGIPPSPSTSLLIPRLTASPLDGSNDWVVPNRQPIIDVEEDNTASAATKNGSDGANRKQSRPAVSIAQNTEAKQTVEENGVTIPIRALHERRISEINPYYDRDRDDDIREFAIEKGKELDILFKPKVYTERSFPEIVLAWEASNLTYYPLYFSDPVLERYGHTLPPVVQPFASIARATVQFLFLPYQMAIYPPCKPESPLGWYRPGDCAPMLHYQVPLNATAAAVEAATITGLFFAIP